MKNILHILDNLFGHTDSSSHEKPEFFEWVRNTQGDHIVLTDNMLHLVDEIKNIKKYAWLVESPVITPRAYNYIKDNHHKFDLIFTFDKSLLEISNKFIFLPIGGCWIVKNDRKIYEKNKNISMIVSSKNMTEGHKLRHEIVKKNMGIDFFGYMNPIKNKIEALKNYRFSVVIENCKKDYYFTEKLIDCFVTGVIPVYWGCPSIQNFFDKDGMFFLQNVDELDDLLKDLTKESYEKRINHVINNFETAKKYVLADDNLYQSLRRNT